ncbi:putative Kinase [Quillaja saponaria]|uniref:non-specific serine/threonine protein kinase n=1 Tax=Quillaja saponaria TaxID=32244 RepID=A0AAD7KVG7_QUISA|nr:putative Kinase [Quillaja saponaria]
MISATEVVSGVSEKGNPEDWWRQPWLPEEMDKIAIKMSDFELLKGFLAWPVGFVYKGILPGGTIVAVKKIPESEFHGDAEFHTEVEIISNLKHRNLVQLIGCCVVDGNENCNNGGNCRYLVNYMPNGNLDDHLFPSTDNQSAKKPLTWTQRKSVVLDVAKGLVYLHYGVKAAIYHRDIRPTNILLDADMRGRVADFRLAKQNKEGHSHVTTRVAGTNGYLAPLCSNVQSIMEKFLLVGILCAHVMVASRPNILDPLNSEDDGRSPTNSRSANASWTPFIYLGKQNYRYVASIA